MITRVVRLLSAFDETSPALSLRELSRRTELPVATTHRLVAELEVEGLIIRDSAGRLRHGHRLWELASRASRANSLREAALAPMEDLLQVTGSNVSLGVMEGTDVLYLERLIADDSTNDITKVAGRLPVHGCSAGLVQMAYAKPEERERFLHRKLQRFTSDTVVDPAQLRTILTQIRQQGFFRGSGLIVEESTGLSVPIFGERDQVLATLSVITVRGQENLAATVPQMNFASRAITRRLGFAPRQGRGHQRRSLEPGAMPDEDRPHFRGAFS